MSLRATSDPTPSTRSATVGDRIEFGAKVENGGPLDASVALVVEDLKDDFAFVFDPPERVVPRKSRARVTFAWTAALPPGKDALTFRGRLALRTTEGKLIGSAPLDLYVTTRR